jgi:hypothetical protein
MLVLHNMLRMFCRLHCPAAAATAAAAAAAIVVFGLTFLEKGGLPGIFG